MAYIGTKPADKPLTSADITDSIITSAKITDATIVNGDIANSTINLTTKVTGTLPVANGGTGLATIGTANQVLAVNSGASALEFQSVSSDFVKLASTTTSSASSVSFDGYFSSTYDNYVIYINGYGCATFSSVPRVRFRRSNADVSASNYRWMSARARRSSGGSGIEAGDNAWDDNYIGLSQDMSNATVTKHNYIIQIPNPLSTDVYPSIIFDGHSTNNDNADYYRRIGFGRLTSTGALSGITFFQDTGNISGTFKLYGIKA